MGQKLASFFGRIKRQTEESLAYQVTIPGGPLAAGTFDPDVTEPDQGDVGTITVNKNVIVAPANISRTLITITNNSLTDDLRYGYDDSATSATEFHILKAGDSTDLEDPGIIYCIPLTVNAVELDVDAGEG